MATGPPGELRRFLRRLAGPAEAGATSDRELLRRFATTHDEAAFTALLQRHGPMVLSVCQRVLHDPHDAEDAFQATFLVLVRKADAIARPELLGNWLHGVAHRTALAAKAQAVRRRAKERQAVRVQTTEPSLEVLWADLRLVLDDEVSRLPAKYRAAFVLCYLQGKTNAEAAHLLGCPKGTVLSRLAWARQRLRGRLTRRGLALSTGLLATVLSQNAASALLPAVLRDFTAKLAIQVAAGAGTAGAVPPRVAALTEGVLKTMRLTRVKNLVALVLALVLLAGGMTMLAQTPRPNLPAEGGNQGPLRPVAAADGPKGDNPDLLNTLLALERRRFEAMSLRDQNWAKRPQAFAELKRLFADDFRAITGWDELLTATEFFQILERTRLNSYTLSDAQLVRVDAGTAILAYKVSREVAGARGPHWSTDRMASTWVRRGDRWVTVFSVGTRLTDSRPFPRDGKFP